jgi:hypothetical protein
VQKAADRDYYCRRLLREKLENSSATNLDRKQQFAALPLYGRGNTGLDAGLAILSETSHDSPDSGLDDLDDLRKIRTDVMVFQRMRPILLPEVVRD